MSSYLTTASASSTYQTISGMSSYLTTASASATYQTISGMSSYLTTASASATYQPQVVGSIIMLAMGTVPSGYLECNGQSVSNSTYGALFTAIGYTYGGTYPSAIFLVPDFRGMFLRGKGTNGTNSDYSSSSSYGFMQSDIIKTHSHNIKFGYNTAYQGTGGSYNAYTSTQPNYNNPGGKIGDLGTGRDNGSTDNNITGNLETRPGNFPVFYCIKY
jgi:microcystin-dependent protein